MKLWQKGYELNKLIDDFTVGNDYLVDQKLLKYDCIASIAHAKMLNKIGVLSKEETNELIECLNKIMELDKKGKFKIKKEQEDCHTAIENYLVEKLDTIGKKIHTARSRNDQVIAALRLYYKDEIKKCKKLVKELIEKLNLLISKHGHVEMPGYTHTRKATPSSVKLWAESFIDSMKDNTMLLDFCYNLIDQSPLGTGPGYGLPIKPDNVFTAKLLGFKKIQSNPTYVQNSRGKFESTLLHALSQIMYDLNKISSDIILFTMSEINYFKLPDELCTGSSIMPQKKNPAALELVRAKYSLVLSYEFQVKNMIAGLISGYNNDLQLTKEPVMNGFQVTNECLSVIALVVSKLKVNGEKCKQELTQEIYATERVYDLVKNGVPFREAYEKIAEQY